MAKCALVIAAMAAVATPRAQTSPPGISLEYAVKATYLYKLAPFVNWPARTFTSPDAPFSICILGHDPFDGYLEKAVAGRRLGTHPFRVQRLRTATPGADCQIVFVGLTDARHVREALQVFEGKPVLTVTDSNDPGNSGSVVQFVIDHGRVRFDVDDAAADRNHLAISSKLLSLALAVKGAG